MLATRSIRSSTVNRRELLASGGAAAGALATWSSLLGGVKALAAEVKTVRIKEIENFPIVIPASPAEVQAGVLSRLMVTRVTTESGVRGYAFGGGFGARAAGRSTAPALLDPVPFEEVRKALLGSDLFAMEQHL